MNVKSIKTAILSRIPTCVFWGLICLSAIVFTYRIALPSMWLDEAYHYMISKRHIDGILNAPGYQHQLSHLYYIKSPILSKRGDLGVSCLSAIHKPIYCFYIGYAVIRKNLLGIPGLLLKSNDYFYERYNIIIQ